jgi:Ca-activated chloride channel family protein
MRSEEFNDDTVDAGDIGAGHTVTAFYELIPPGSETDALPRADPLKYSIQTDTAPDGGFLNELLTVKVRYKLPQETESELLSFPVRTDSVRRAGEESQDFTFAASVAGFGMLLRESPYKGAASYDTVLAMAQNSAGEDEFGYRAGFLKLIEDAMTISRPTRR